MLRTKNILIWLTAITFCFVGVTSAEGLEVRYGEVYYLFDGYLYSYEDLCLWLNEWLDGIAKHSDVERPESYEVLTETLEGLLRDMQSWRDKFEEYLRDGLQRDQQWLLWEEYVSCLVPALPDGDKSMGDDE